ncbi:hypothetical protein MHEC_11250 [Mycobacterium heckeshornense]|uniref:DNA-binding response regulator n=1 Tax=Mycobacterium heckeshornense TaxID=110505 RepID=A0A7R7GRP3_9MYCO|nr:hypothetical protein MHEC_11250 [Mycobacterium heckeshornense]
MSGYARDQRPRQAILGQLPRIHRADGSPIRVLLVDDEPALTNLVKMALHYEGWVVDVAHNGREAVAKFDKIGPDVLVLDIMLPDVDGLEVLQRVRESDAYTPTLFLTARDSVMDRVTGLTAGADDYMTKPFSLEELVARLRGLLRRSSHLTPPADEVLTVGDLTLDGASREVTRGGTPISLSSTEFELLRFMMRNPRRALSRTEILDRVWNYDFAGRTSIVDLYISYLRKKIDADNQPMIHTVRGVGYMLRPPGMTPARRTRWWRPRSMRRQLLLGVLAVVSVVLAAVGVVSVLSLRGYVTAMTDAELAESLDAFAHSYARYHSGGSPGHTVPIGEAMLGFTEQTPGNLIAVVRDGVVLGSAVFFSGRAEAGSGRGRPRPGGTVVDQRPAAHRRAGQPRPLPGG